MPKWLRDAVIVIATAATTTILVLGTTPTLGQSQQVAQVPRSGDGRVNLTGIWQAVGTAHWDIQSHAARPALAVVPGPATVGLDGSLPGEIPAAPVLALGAIGGVPGGVGVVDGEEIPYQPWAAARRKENFDNVLTRDPEVKCYLPGIPRATYMPYPFQIIQGTDKIMMVYEYAAANRTIHMDTVEPAPIATWMGHSVGRWDGDALVVTVTDQVEQTWFDRSGNFHSDALKVTERYTPMGPDHLQYQATIEDPKVFTRPWTISLPLYRRKDPRAQLVEYKCVEFVEELMYGDLRKQQLVTHWEGELGDAGGTLVIDVTRRRPVSR